MADMAMVASSVKEEEHADQSSHISDKVASEEQGEAVMHSDEGEVGGLKAGDAGGPQATEVSFERIPEEPVFDGIEGTAGPEDHEEEGSAETGARKSQNDSKNIFPVLDFSLKGLDWPEKAASVKNFVKERGVVVKNVIRRLSGKMEDLGFLPEKDNSRDGQSPAGERSPSAFHWSFKDSPDGPLQNSNGDPKMKGRITLFTKCGCQDSRAVRSFLRRKGLSYVEVNVDIFLQRRLELEERTGTSTVPQVFFNEAFLGGIDELNALDAKMELDQKIAEVFEIECPPTAPQAPVYGEDEPPISEPDEFVEVVRKMREKVQVKDRFYKMRLFSRCFVGLEAVEELEEDQHCDRDEAVEYGREVMAKHFFAPVLQENIFEDGNYLYRFLEHDPVISTKCFNFNGCTNDMEPLSATEIEANLRKFTLAIIDSYVSDDGKQVDYRSISISEEFRRYLKMTQELHRFDLSRFSREEKLAFFINLYNIMTIHAIIILGHPTGPLDRRWLFGDFQYVVGGYPFSLSAIQNGVLRGNQRPPYQLIKPFGPKDKRLPVALLEPEPLIHFALTSASRSSPALKCYSPAEIDAELRAAVRAFFLDGGVVINMEEKTVSLGKIIKWFSVDFGKNEADILRWLVDHLEPSKADNLLELWNGNQLKVVYQTYDWTPNL